MTTRGTEISTVALMFTDLVGSTELYNRIGDQAAYEAIQGHFAALSATVKKHRGELVKTMGDSIMAVFAAPADAMKAALEIQRASQASRNSDLRIRIGLHYGPCHTQEADGIRDYFGAAVNMAARVEGLGRGGEILLTDSMLADEMVARLAAAYTGRSRRFQAILKGFAEEVELVCIEFPVVIPAESVSAPTYFERAQESVQLDEGAVLGGSLFKLAGQLAILLVAMSLSSCLRGTTTTAPLSSPGAASSDSGSLGGFAFSGNGESYTGDPTKNGHYAMFVRQPGFRCSSSSPVLGYGGMYYNPAPEIAGEGSDMPASSPATFIPDPCTGTIVDPTSLDPVGFTGLGLSGYYQYLAGQVYEVADLSGDDSGAGLKESLAAEDISNVAVCTGDFDDGGAEVQLTRNVVTGLYSVTLFLDWNFDPATSQPVLQGDDWRGLAGSSTVSVTEVSGSYSISGPGILVQVLSESLADNPRGYHGAHVTLTMPYGQVQSVDGYCGWAFR